jgi:Fe-S-cluster containining protein
MLAHVRRAFAEVLRRQGYVSVVDVLVEMRRLRPASLEDWRFGRIPYLERVVEGSLAKLSLIGREIRKVARAQGLSPSLTVYRRWGRGPRRTLRFSKSGLPSIEQAYSTHWVSRHGRARPPSEGGGAGAPALADGRSIPAEEVEEAPSPERAQAVLQPGVPVVRDPERVRHLAAEKRDENESLRRFLKWGGPPPRLVDRLFHRLQAEVGAEIDCTECANCCREMSPTLRPKDVDRLARRLGMPHGQFRATHLEAKEDGLVFARTPCPLLDGNRCSCYRDRPKDCRSYPHLQKKHMTTRLLGVIGNASVCPIVFSVLERLKAELLERGLDWRAGSGGSFPTTILISGRRGC